MVAKTSTARLCITGRLVSGYSVLLPSSPPTLSRIMDHKTACTRARLRVTGCLNALWSSCVMQSVNSRWTCSDARNIGRYNSSRYDSIRYTQYRFRYDTDPIIVCSLVFNKLSILHQTKLNYDTLHIVIHKLLWNRQIRVYSDYNNTVNETIYTRKVRNTMKNICLSMLYRASELEITVTE